MMRRRWWVEGFHDGFWLVAKSGWGERADTSPDVEALAPEAAVSRMDEWFPHRWGGAHEGVTLAEIAAALGEELLWPSDTSASARQKSLVRQALRDGRLVALRVRLPAPAGSVIEQEDDARPAEAAPGEDKTWIEIALVDDSDPPQPVPFRKYRVELPDGSSRQGMLDANGKAMLVGIDAGTCEVSFPGLDANDWRPA
jgi:hypothetical protein